jgi:hypothetical protein
MDHSHISRTHKIRKITHEYDFDPAIKQFLYDLLSNEPSDAIDTLYSEAGLDHSHPSASYEAKVRNIINYYGFEGIEDDIQEFFNNIMNIGPDKAIDEFYKNCL